MYETRNVCLSTFQMISPGGVIRSFLTGVNKHYSYGIIVILCSKPRAKESYLFLTLIVSLLQLIFKIRVESQYGTFTVWLFNDTSSDHC